MKAPSEDVIALAVQRLLSERDAAQAAARAAVGGAWIWQAEDNDLGSMSDSMVVTLTAGTLRQLIADEVRAQLGAPAPPALWETCIALKIAASAVQEQVHIAERRMVAADLDSFGISIYECAANLMRIAEAQLRARAAVIRPSEPVAATPEPEPHFHVPASKRKRLGSVVGDDVCVCGASRQWQPTQTDDSWTPLAWVEPAPARPPLTAKPKIIRSR